MPVPVQGQFPGLDGVDTQLLGTEVVRAALISSTECFHNEYNMP